MPRLQPTEIASGVLTQYSRQQFVCRTCRARLIRQLHASPRVRAEQPLLERLKNSIFGSKEAKEKEKKREEAQQKAIAKAAAAGADGMTIRKSKGVRYQIAPIVDQKATPPGYVPATTWDGLEHIGGKHYVRTVQDRGEVYKGFMPPQRAKLTDDRVAELIHHIAVEVLVLQKAGRDLNEVCHPRSNEHQDWRHTRNATITLGDDGNASLRFTSDVAEAFILDAIPKEARANKTQVDHASTIGLSGREIGHAMIGNLSQYPKGSTPWMDMKLRDPNLKLVIIKRLLQLTGARPSDHLLSSATTLEGLYNAFKIKEKPKKLAQSEELLSMNDEIPNLTVHQRKRSMIDKEMAVGRWKVIEEELMKRDLPVTGSRWPQAKPVVTAEWVRQ